MRKYYCDYCDKYIQETRKLHNRTEGHKKNKESYYSGFPDEINLRSGCWEDVISSEEQEYINFLERNVLSSLYKRFKRSDSPPTS